MPSTDPAQATFILPLSSPPTCVLTPTARPLHENKMMFSSGEGPGSFYLLYT